MTKEDAITYIEEWLKDEYALNEKDKIVLEMSLKALKQQSFMNKPCISAGVCEHDKMQVLDNVRVEIEQAFIDDGAMQEYTVKECLRIIVKHIAKSEG